MDFRRATTEVGNGPKKHPERSTMVIELHRERALFVAQLLNLGLLHAALCTAKGGRWRNKSLQLLIKNIFKDYNLWGRGVERKQTESQASKCNSYQSTGMPWEMQSITLRG